MKKLFVAILAPVLLAAAAHSAPLIVTTTSDGVAGSLRNLIQTASAEDTIVFQIPTSDPGYNASTGYWVITLTGATAANKTLVIDKNLTIDGSAQKIVVRRDNAAPTDFRIFNVNTGIKATFIHLWISNGNVTTETGGALPKYGAGIRSFGNLTVRDCIFTGNAAGEAGGAILNFSHLTLIRSTFSGNSATFYGGAIYNASTKTDFIDTCTFTGNNAPNGGAIFNNQTTLFIRSSTITGNTAAAGGSRGGGGFVTNAGAPHFENTIIVGNTAPIGPDVSGTIISDGHNLLGSTADNSGFGASGDQTGVTPASAKLKALGNYGGLTPTMPPQVGSFAIDKGKRTTDENGQLVDTDQRGLPRQVDRPESNSPVGDASDIGAVEAGTPQAGPSFTVTTTADSNDGECSSDDCSLLEALNAANANADANIINFAPGVTGSILTASASFGLPISSSVTINGPGARSLSIAGSGTGRLVNITGSGAVVNISGLSLINGKANGSSFPDNVGGAILNKTSLTLTDCTLSGNSSTSSGGCIYNNGLGGNATLTLVRCTLSGNSASNAGGGVCSVGYNGHATANLTNCTLDQNSAQYGGAIYNDGTSDGNASVTLTNCTLNKNSAGTIAGGIYNDALNPSSAGVATLLLRNTILRAGSSGANLYNDSAAGGGTITSQGNNLSSDAAGATGADATTTGPAGFLNAAGDKRNTDPMLDILQNNGGPTDTVALLSNSTAINTGNDANAPGSDQRGFSRVGVSDIGAFEFGSTLPTPSPTPSSTPNPTATPTATATATATPGLVGNVSTRLPVGTGDEALIEGFIVQGPAGATKKIMVRAIGPSLAPFGITDALADPILEIHDAGGATVATNDNWRSTQPGGLITGDQSAEISGSGVAPGNDLESAIIANLAPGSYTAVVRGLGNTVGTGVVDAYDLSAASPARLANIATRGLIQPGDKLMIAGFIIQNGPVKAVVRAIGPSLLAFGITNALADTTLQLRDQNGAIVRENDNWMTDQKAELENTGLQPTDDLEAALVETIQPGQYTAQVRGKNDSSGIGVVQVYFLQ